MFKLHCFNCGRIVATVKGEIIGEYTWFSICSECLYNISGLTKKEFDKLKK